MLEAGLPSPLLWQSPVGTTLGAVAGGPGPPSPELWMVSVTAFAVVFLLLGALAALMAALVRLFPVPRPAITAEEAAAVTAAVAATLPGARVTRIEEVR
jgi:hypothetical protein